jgi:hypothetical protein
MSIVPTVVISNTAHGASNGEYNGTSRDWYTNKYQGRGYFGYSDGLHTFSYKVTGFVGVIRVQATLATDPTEDDWFTIQDFAVGDGSMPTTDNTYSIATGNFVWIRIAVTNFTAGTINKVLYN